MIDVEELIDLARKGHSAEVSVGNLKGNLHKPMECAKCLNIAAAEMKVSEAEQSESYVVLYIP